MSSELWVSVPGFEKRYAVSNLGRICGFWHYPVILAPRFRRGYLATSSLKKNKKQWHAYVHQVVALAFLGPCPKGKQINHKDGNKLNNRADNLEYVTSKENILHSIANGLAPIGEDRAWNKLTVDQVLELRSLYPSQSQASLARQFGISQQTVSRIIRRKKWKHI